LPAAEKMQPAGYRDIAPDDIPRVTLDGGWVKVVAGRVTLGERAVEGPVAGGSTDPLYLDVCLEAGAQVRIPVEKDYTALAYAFDGEISAPGGLFRQGQLAVFSAGETVELTAGPEGGRLLLLAGRPLGEPIVHYGPFVMNTVEEVEQALRDYRDGRLTA